MIRVKELKTGDSINQPLLIASCNEGVTASGSPYLSLQLQDTTGSVEAKLWDVKANQKSCCAVGKVITVKGDVINYKGRNQIKLLDVMECTDAINPEDFRMTTKIDLASLKKMINDAVESIEDSSLQTITRELLKEAGDDFYQRPAAVKNHHEFRGGLATHETSMLKLALSIQSLYPFLNRDLLVAGVLLHDIGKIKELSDGIVPEYTLRGKLLGHISIGNAMIEEAANRLGIANEESIILLQHLILSHHGEHEFGSPQLPAIPEAEALHFIDNIDARMEMIRKAMDDTKPGEFTLRLFPLENRMFYRMHTSKRTEEKPGQTTLDIQ